MRERLRIGPTIVLGALGLTLVAAPHLGDYTLFVLALVVIQVIAALSLNLLMGYAGQVSLGQAALVGIGAFGAAQFANWMPFPLTIVAGTVLTVLLSVLVGLPSLRIRGLQIAATTLALGLVAEHLLFARPWDGSAGKAVAIPRPDYLVDGRRFLLAAVAALLLVLVLDRMIRRSRVGRAFYAVRDRDDTAAARGVAVGPTKLLAYGLSGIYAGIAGGMMAYLLELVTPDSFTVFASLTYVAAVVVGGAGSWSGVAVAAAAFTALPELLRPARTYAPLVGAILLAAVPLMRPEGLGWVLERPYLFLRRRTRDQGKEQGALASAAAVEAEREIAPPRRSLQLVVPVRTILRTEDVAVRFGGVQALQGVSMEVRRGEIVGLIGPNGAGKSTFYNCLSGFVRPDRGSVTYRGRDLLALPAEARPSLGIVRTFQQVGLSPALSVFDNVLLAQHTLAAYTVAEAILRAPRARAAEATLAARATAALRFAGIEDLAHEPVGRLPHGRQRMAEVAAALAMGPELLLLDEPFAGLGPDESEVLARRLVQLREDLGLTMVVIEHDVPLVARMSDYVYVLDQGRVLAEGTPAEIQRDPDVSAIYLGDAPAAAREEVSAGV